MSIPFEMLMSSVTIIVLVLVMSAIFIKSKQKTYAFCFAPVALIPTIYLLGWYLAYKADVMFGASRFVVHLCLILLSFAAVFILSGIACTKLQSLSRRIITYVLILSFSAIYTAICIFRLPYFPA